jgi:Lhr-like helicase
MLGLTAVPEEDYGRFRFHADRYVKGDTWTKFLDAFRDGDVLQYIQEKLWQTAWEKAPATADLVTKVLLSESPDDKILIFTERVKCAEEIVRLIEKKEPGAALLHHGSLGDDKRRAIIENFHEPRCNNRVLVSTRQSLATGVNLQCANRVVFNDLPWSPADIAQAAARVRRLNQKKGVREFWIVASTEFDQNLLTVLQLKMEIMLNYNEGKNVTEEQMKWMNKAVSWKVILGVPASSKKGRKKRRSSKAKA